MTNKDKVPEGTCPNCLRPKMAPFAKNDGRCFAEWENYTSMQADKECTDLHIARLQARIKLLETERTSLVLEMHRHYHPDRYKYDGRFP